MYTADYTRKSPSNVEEPRSVLAVAASLIAASTPGQLSSSLSLCSSPSPCSHCSLVAQRTHLAYNDCCPKRSEFWTPLLNREVHRTRSDLSHRRSICHIWLGVLCWFWPYCSDLCSPSGSD